MENDFYVRLLRSFFSWSPRLLLEFIEVEKGYILKTDYLRIENKYLGSSEYDLLEGFLVEEEYMKNFATLFKDREVYDQWKSLDVEDFLKWLPWEYKEIMICLKKGYALEWLRLAGMSDEELEGYINQLSTIPSYKGRSGKIVSPENYRIDIISDNEKLDTYFHHRLMGQELIRILFFGLKNLTLFPYYQEITDSLEEFELLSEFRSLYNEIHNEILGWKRDLFKEEEGSITRKKTSSKKNVKQDQGRPKLEVNFRDEETERLKKEEFKKYLEDNNIPLLVEARAECDIAWVTLVFCDMWQKKGDLLREREITATVAYRFLKEVVGIEFAKKIGGGEIDARDFNNSFGKKNPRFKEHLEKIEKYIGNQQTSHKISTTE